MNEDCPHCVFEITEANCRGCFEGSHYKPKPITNAERIRAMTDEELAEELWAWNQVCCYKWTKDKILKWLKEEAK